SRISRVRQGALGGHRLGQRAPSGRMTRRRRPWDRHRELADKDTASRWPSSAKSMFDGDGNADRPIYISQTSASSRSSYFTREGLRRARSFRRRPNRVHRTRLGRTAHTRQSNRGRGRMRDRTRSPEYDGSSSGLVSCAFSSCRDNKSNSPSHSRRSNRYTNYMSHASPCSAGSTSACGYRPRTRSVRTRRRRIGATPNKRKTKPSAGRVNGFPSSGPRRSNEVGKRGGPPAVGQITVSERGSKTETATG